MEELINNMPEEAVMSKSDFLEAGECCMNCAHCYTPYKLDYTHGGCDHTLMEGYICMAFADERIADWMYGVDPNTSLCEAFTLRGKNEELSQSGKI